jgi:hypothetical protein
MITEVFVFPSGVECEIEGLMGEHQRMLTEGDNAKNSKGINLILKDRFKRIGEKTNITEADIKRLLSADRKYALVRLRQLSLNFQKEFKFSYEFPTEGGRKEKFQYSIEFDENDFVTRPYGWVQAAIAKAKKEGVEAVSEGFPKLFDSYSELEEYREQEFKLPITGQVVKWQLLDGNTEEMVSKIDKKKLSSHTAIQLRKPRVQDGEQLVNLNLDKLPLADIEALREHMLYEVEANVETDIEIKHKDDELRSARVDLVATPAFFFPSMAR